MQTTFKFFVPLFICLGLLLVSGCGGQGASGGASVSNGGGGDTALVGKWSSEHTKSNEACWELLADGTVLFGGFAKGTWKAESGRLDFSFPDPYQIYSIGLNYKISGNSLTITDDGGGGDILERQ